MRDRIFNFNTKGYAIIIECFRCILAGVIQSYGLYWIIQVVSPNLMIWIRSLAKVTFLAENKQTHDQCIDASTNTIK